MKVRADITKMLRGGSSQREIIRTLRVSYKTVTRTRVALHMPAPARSAPPQRPLATEFYARTKKADGGHLRWTGFYANGSPKLGREGATLSAYRVGFELLHGRPPVGQARPGCGYPKCVAPDHLEDQPMREQLRSQMAGIFGGAR